jgi:tetratricopeptide (TPR) repeat protein
MELKASIAQLEAAKGDPYALALATLDIVLASHKPGLKHALEAAAIPHWFDERTLQALLEESVSGEGDWFHQLIELTVIEPFYAHDAWNVHEVTRLALRSRVSKEKPDRFRTLSRITASLFESGEWPHVVERIYHRLTSDPDQGVSELSLILYEWYQSRRREPMQALAGVLEELSGGGLLTPKAHGYALIALGRIREERIDVGKREEMAREAVKLLKASRDEVGLADAYLLLGQVLMDRGRSGEALSVYENARASLEKGTENHPEVGVLESKRADLHESVGRALNECGRLAEAQEELEANLALRESLSRMEPENYVRRHHVAVARVDVGDSLLPTTQYAKAEKHFNKALETLMELRAQKQGPDDVEVDIGRLQIRLGDSLKSRVQLDGAMEHFEASEEIFEKLTISEPDNFVFKADLVTTHARIADLHALWKQLDLRVERLKMADQILDDLIEKDPSDPRWKNHLAVLKIDLGTLEEEQGNFVEASQKYRESVELFKELSEEDPERVAWKLSLAVAQERLGGILNLVVTALEDHEQKAKAVTAMFQTYVDAAAVRDKLIEYDPENIEWKRAHAVGLSKLSYACRIAADEMEAGLDLQLGEEWTVAKTRERALGGYTSATLILSKLAQQAPHDVILARTLMNTFLRGAEVLNTMGRREESLATYQAALPMARALTQLDANIPQLSQDVKHIEGVIAEMEGEGVEAAEIKPVEPEDGEA